MLWKGVNRCSNVGHLIGRKNQFCRTKTSQSVAAVASDVAVEIAHQSVGVCVCACVCVLTMLCVCVCVCACVIAPRIARWSIARVWVVSTSPIIHTITHVLTVTHPGTNRARCWLNTITHGDDVRWLPRFYGINIFFFAFLSYGKPADRSRDVISLRHTAMATTNQIPEVAWTGNCDSATSCDVTRWRIFPTCTVSLMRFCPVGLVVLVVYLSSRQAFSHLSMTSSPPGEPYHLHSMMQEWS